MSVPSLALAPPAATAYERFAGIERLYGAGSLARLLGAHVCVVGVGGVGSWAAEALARWHHPEHGQLNPIQFLETVERSGQLPAFADAVLNQALTAADTWREAGFDMPIAVNVSPHQLAGDAFLEAVRDALAATGLAPHRLCLEITETAVVADVGGTRAMLSRLRELGVERRQRIHGLRQHLLGDAAHLGDLAAEPFELRVVG